ncbi:MAG: group II intron reverse transcriptase/maturase, partial [Syntrophothermus sp.]|nr:group II intron reverse transcriptase/maturase [Syntrophothermus sp.]
MTQRLPNTVPTGYLCNDTVEPESSRGAHSAVIPKKAKTKMGADALLEMVLDRNNLNQAFKRVKQNGGGAGIDGMTVDQMLPYLRAHGSNLLEELASGKYRPQPVKRVEIPKPDGGKRLLGVPTVIDRMVQQAIVQVLQPIFEPTFSDSSFGFRPKRSAQQA